MKNIQQNHDQLSPLQRAALAVKEMRSRLDAMERQQTEEIAIIGMGCQFPGGASNPESFWQLLRNGIDATTEVPSQRWDVDTYYDSNPETPGKTNTKRGGFLKTIETFDAEFFGLSPREALTMDPQQRLLLEVSHSALENAGQAADKLIGSKTGVFVGISINEYAQTIFNNADIDIYTATGNALSVAAGRLSYALGLQGPSLVVDTACSSSLVAVHLACQSLRAGECRLALAGGAYLMVSPQSTIAMSKLRALSPDGRCKTFDASADGYGRGEGCGMVVLKRLSDALRDNDNILACIRGSAVNQDGRSSGLTVPNGQAQEALIRAALDNAKVDPTQISYVETHGTGTPLGDPLEVKALGNVLGVRTESQQLTIGSVKTNIGHLEAAAGIASLIKVVLAMQHGEIPPHLHLKQLNPHISLEGGNISIPTKLTPWPVETEQKRLAGVSSFGFSGTNAHLIVEQAPARQLTAINWERPLHLLTLSAKSETALKSLAESFASYLETHPSVSLRDVCFTANAGRSHFEYRRAIVANSPVEACQQLLSVTSSSDQPAAAQKIAFLFSGQGCEYPEMGRQLYETQPQFQNAIQECNQLLESSLGKSLLTVLYPQSSNRSVESSCDEIIYAAPALFAVEYALAKLWQSWGIEPTAVMGCGVGEYVAACIAEVLSLEAALKLTIASDFEKLAQELTYSSPTIDFISPETGTLANKEVLQENYWCVNRREIGQISESMKTFCEQDYTLFVEIGPGTTLIEASQKQLANENGTWLPSLQKGTPDWQVMLPSLGRLYERGIEVNWDAFDRGYRRQKIELPTYPFERQRYWIDASPNQRFVETNVAEISPHPFLGRRVRSPLQPIQFESQFILEKLPLVRDHYVYGIPVVNLVIYLETALAGAMEAFGKPFNTVEEAIAIQPLAFDRQTRRTIQLILTPEVDEKVTFQIFSQAEVDWALHLTGKLSYENPERALAGKKLVNIEQIKAQCQEEIPSEQLYEKWNGRGAYVGPGCQLLERVYCSEGEALGKISANEQSDNQYQLPLSVIDTALQLLFGSYSSNSDSDSDANGVILLASFSKFQFYANSRKEWWGHAKWHSETENGSISTNIRVSDETGQILIDIENIQSKRLPYETLQRQLQRNKTVGNSAVQKDGLSAKKLLALPPTERQQRLEVYLIESVASSLQISPAKLNSKQQLSTLVDSLIAFELRSAVETDLQIQIPLEKFFGETNISSLAELLLERILTRQLQSKLASQNLSEELEEIAL